VLRATSEVQLDTERVRVTEWCFCPGAATGWHTHEYDYIVVPLTTGALRLDEADGSRTVQLEQGKSYARAASVQHDVVNPNAFEFRFVEIELKPPPSR